jgi:uncharacterized protein
LGVLHHCHGDLLVDHQTERITMTRPVATFLIYTDKAGGYRWRLMSANGRIVADSGEAYSTRNGARRAAGMVRHHAAKADAKIVK